MVALRKIFSRDLLVKAVALALMLPFNTHAQTCSFRIVNTNDFGAGTSMFGQPLPPGVTTYLYQNGAPLQKCGTLNYAKRVEDGSYCRVKNPSAALQTCNNGRLSSDWSNATDHTGNGGYMIVCNAAGTPDIFYQREYDSLCSGMTCEFSIWVTNVCHLKNIQPIVRIELRDPSNDAVIQSISSGLLPYPTPTALNWQQLKMIFTVPNGFSSVKVVVRNDQSGNGGNDLALDDVAFSVCVPPATLATVSSAGAPEDCTSQFYNITATVDETAFTNITFQWQQLLTDGTWLNITNPNGIHSHTLTTPRLQAAGGPVSYRCLYASEGNLSSLNCSGISDTTTVTPKDHRPLQPQVATNAPVCETSPLTFTFSSATAGASFYWTTPAGNNAVVASPYTIPQAAITDSGTYSFQSYLNGCYSDTINVNIQIKPMPALPTITWTPVCEGLDQVLTANSTTIGVTYNWTGGSKPLVIAENTATITNATVADNGLYNVSATLNNCTSALATEDIQIKPMPALPTITWTPVCEGLDQVLTANSTTIGVAYNWTGGSKPLVVAGNTATITNATTADNGLYNVSATLNNCTSALATEDIQIKPLPVLPTITWTPVCEGLDQVLTANSTTIGVTYNWTGGSKPLVVAGNIATITNATTADNGLYNVSATLNNCTSALATEDIQIKPIPALPVITWTPVCEGSDQVLTANSTTIGVTYNWTGGSKPLVVAGNTATITNATTADNGLYNVSATLNNCTSALATEDIQIKLMPALPTITWTPVCEGSDQVLTANSTTIGVTYNWTGGSKPLVVAGNTATITNATLADNGLYNVSATLNNCTSALATENIQIKLMPALPTITWTPVCEGVDQLLTANSTTIGVTYNWTGGSKPLVIAENTATITNATVADNGLYNVSATLNNCTSAQATEDIQIKPIPALPTITWTPVCEGIDQVLTANTTTIGVTYNWTGGSKPLVVAGNTATITNATTADNGLYNVSATLNNCTSALATENIQIKPQPAQPTITWTPVCEGVDQVLTANTTTIGVTYNWTGGSKPLVIADNTATITDATVADNGLYNVSAILNSCASSLATVDVQIKPTPIQPTITWTPVCEGLDQVLIANTTTAGVRYNWTGGTKPLVIAKNTATITNATIADNGLYNVSATLNNCVSALGSADVQIKPVPVQPTITWAPVCEGFDQVLTANTVTEGVTFNWTGGSKPLVIASNTATITNATIADDGLYNVSAMLNNCTSTMASADVQIKPVPAQPTITWTPVCEGVDQVLIANTTTIGVTYNWTGGSNTLVIAGNTATITNATVADNGIYNVSAIYNSCASALASADVQIKPIPVTPVASSNSPLCEGFNLLLNAMSSTPGNMTYAWTGPAGFTSNQQNPLISQVSMASAGIYNVNAMLNGCTSASASLTVTIHPKPSDPIVTNPKPECVGGDAIHLDDHVTSAESLIWLAEDSTLIGSAAPVVPTTIAGTFLYYVASYSARQCRSQVLNIEVIINENPTIVASVKNVSCLEGSDGSIILEVSGGAAPYSYAWNTGSSNKDLINLSAGVYSVTVTDQKTCVGKTDVSVNDGTNPTPPIAQNQEFCQVEGTLMLTAQGTNLQWYDEQSQPLSSAPYIDKNIPSSYTFYVSSKNDLGCESEKALVTALVRPTPKIKLVNLHEPECYGYEKGYFEVNADSGCNNSSYLYKLLTTMQVQTTGLFNDVSPGVHVVEATDECGCASTLEVKMGIKMTNCYLQMPSAFTPNGDNLNDRFRPASYGPITNFKMQIFNREGLLMFESRVPEEGWDGTFKQRRQPPDTYVWHVTYKNNNGELKFLKGTLVLIR